MQTKVYFDDGAKSFLIIFLLSQLFFTNGILLFGGMLVFYMLMVRLQQPFKPSVFTIILIYHFIQISAGVWQSNYLGKDINYRSDSTMTATIASYAGLIFLFGPIIYYQNKIPALNLQKLTKHADRLSIDKTFNVYLATFFGMGALQGIAFAVPALTQIILSLTNLKWFMFLLFAFQSIIKNRRRKELYFFIGLEFALGFFSYFSEFKTIIFFVAFLALTFLTVVRLNKLLIAVVAMVFLVFGGIFWTSIKDEYRSFLNKGSKSQTVQVEKGEALDKLLELSDKRAETGFTQSTVNFLDRLQYTYHFAKTIDRVPRVIPYQDGTNWGNTLLFVVTPRALNADKGVYDASVKASKYTGIQYAGIRKGVSVSLGYFADGYIDFGIFGMYIPLLILGFIYGIIYFYFIKNASTNFIFNYSIVGAMFMGLFAFESDNIFVIGQIYVNLVVFYLLKVFVFPKLLAYIQMPLKPLVTS